MLKNIVILLLLFVAAACNSIAASQADSESAKTKSKLPILENYSTRIYGKIANGPDDKVVIITNWKKRSRIFYIVHGEYAKQLKENTGKFASVSGKVLKDNNYRFRKELLVTKIISIDDKPKRQFFPRFKKRHKT